MKKLTIERGAYEAPWTSVFLLQQEYNFCNTGTKLDPVNDNTDEIEWEDE